MSWMRLSAPSLQRLFLIWSFLCSGMTVPLKVTQSICFSFTDTHGEYERFKVIFAAPPMRFGFSFWLHLSLTEMELTSSRIARSLHVHMPISFVKTRAIPR